MTAPCTPPQQAARAKPSAALSEADEWQRAHDDALRSMRNTIDPSEAAGWMGLAEIGAIHGAIQSHGAWRLPHDAAADPDLLHTLRLAGLVEIHTPFLTAHGMAVRRVIKDAAR